MELLGYHGSGVGVLWKESVGLHLEAELASADVKGAFVLSVIL